MPINTITLFNALTGGPVVTLECMPDRKIEEQQGAASPIFTLLLAPNGCLKSTILKCVADDLIGQKVSALPHKRRGLNRELAQYRAVLNKSSHAPYKLEQENAFPERVIAISGTSADRFPIKRLGDPFHPSFSDRYVYFGQRANTNLISRKQSQSALLAEYLRIGDQSKNERLKVAYEFLDLNDAIRFTVRPKARSINTIVPESRYLADALKQLRHGNRVHSEEKIIAAAIDFCDSSRSRTDIIEIREGKLSCSAQSIPYESLRLLQAVGQLRIEACEVEKTDRGWLDLMELSSGEFQMFSSILGLALSVEDYAIVLIDEPENSLHPEWQAKYLDLINKAICGVSGLHVLIASHSPLIASGFPFGNSRILVGKKSEKRDDFFEYATESSDVFLRSADDLLVQLFKLPSARNFFFAQRVQRAVELFSSGSIETDEYQELLSYFEDLLPKVNTNDPIRDVLEVFLSTNSYSVE